MAISYGGLKSTDQYYNSTVLLLNGDDAPNAAHNNTFVDSSSNNFTITRNGNTTQGSFSPFSLPDGYWSNYFDGATDWLGVASNPAFAFGTGDFTVEFWIYKQAFNGTVVSTKNSSVSSNGIIVWTSGGIGAEVGGTNVITNAGSMPLNVWTHGAITRSSGTMRAFINGVQVASVANSTDLTDSTLYISRKVDGSSIDNLNAYISNLRIIKGTALYTANFTPSTTPLTAVTNTSLLVCQNNRIKDNSANNFAITRNGDVSVQPFSPLNQIPAMQSTGWSHYFDGQSYLTAPNNPAFKFGSNNFTIEFWYYPTSLTGTRYLCNPDNGFNNSSYAIFTSGANAVYNLTSNGSFEGNIASGVLMGTPTLNSWNHFALVRNGNTFTPYINGVAGTVTVSSASLFDFSSSLGIGSNPRTISAPSPANGYISNFRIVKGTAVYTSNFTPPFAPLTAVTNTSLLTCQYQTFNDASSNNFTITRNGNVTPSTLSPFKALTNYSPTVQGGSAYFDGTGDYLTVPTNAAFTFGTGDFTIECWVNSNSTNYGIIVTWRADGFNGTEQDLMIFYTGAVQWRLNNSALITGTKSIYGAGWTHIAVVKSSGNTKLYINGTQDGSTYVDSNNYPDANTTLKIGYQPNQANDFNGYMADFRIVKGTALYTANFTPPTAPLASVINTSLLLNFTNAGIVDYSADNVIETVGNAQISTSVVKYGTGSLYFDGTGDWLQTRYNPNLRLGGDFTIEFWAYPISRVSTYPCIISNYSTYAANGLIGIFCGHLSSTTKWSVAVNGVDQVLVSNSTISYNTWVHVAITRSGSTMTMYINGVSESTSTQSAAIVGTQNSWWIGVSGDNTGSTGYNGYLCDLRVTNGFNRYTANFRPPNKLPRVRIT